MVAASSFGVSPEFVFFLGFLIIWWMWWFFQSLPRKERSPPAYPVCPNCGSEHTGFDIVYKNPAGGLCLECGYRGATFPEMTKEDVPRYRQRVRGAYVPLWSEYPVMGKIFLALYLGVSVLGFGFVLGVYLIGHW